LGVLSCLYLNYYLPPTSWLRFAAWLNFGFVIYVGYGSVNSRLTGRGEADQMHAHDAHTAYTGAILAVVGAALLFFMRAFDVFLAAMKTHADMGGDAKWAALGDVFTGDPWLTLSWFLVVPLALNALLLCPIVIRRALRVRNAPDTASFAGYTAATFAIAAVLGLGSIIYLIPVVSAWLQGRPSVF